jgi:signal transduction histidine kinase/ligand-binding sensor domain-containing protein
MLYDDSDVTRFRDAGSAMKSPMPAMGHGGLKRNLLLQTGRLLLCTTLVCASAAALNPNRQITQYAHTAWRIQDGAFAGTPYAIAQTTNGYLWIGTEGGLVRFDGVRFVPWIAPEGKRLPSPRVYSLLGASDGSLWIGTGSGLARWKNAELVSYPEAAGFVESILEDPNGTVWMTRSQVRDEKGPLCGVTGGVLKCYGPADGIPFVYAQPMVRDDLGDIWIGSSLGLCRWNPGSASTFLPPALEQAKGLSGVAAVATGSDGSLWVGMRRSGKGLGLQTLAHGIWKEYVVPGMDGTALEVAALLVDRDNGLWVGTSNHGIYRVHGGKADHFGSADGLSSDSVGGFYQDREGDLWVATSRGIDRFHDTRVVSYSIREGLTEESVGSVLASRDGTVWIGNARALDSIRQGKLSAVRERNGLPGRLVTSLFEDHAGRLWVGVDGGLTVYEQRRFRPISKPDGSPLGVVTAITEDSDHNIWATVTKPAILRIEDLQVKEEVSPPQIPRAQCLAADPKSGIWLGLVNGNLARYQHGRLEIVDTNHGPSASSVRNIMVDSDGSTWAATGQGLVRWKDGTLKTLDSRNGLPCDGVFAVVKDNMGSLWLDAQCGLVTIPGSELEKWWKQSDATVKVTALDVFDGAQPGLTNFRPEASKSPDGKLWFANDSILQEVDPGHLEENVLPPPVQVEQVIADRRNYIPQENIRLPARTRDIEIDYAALSFEVPEKVKFRYKMEGYDAGWQDPQTRRQAFYSNLPPGNYQFHVIACNDDGVWNEMGATMGLTIVPAFFQTTWFRLLSCAIVAGILWQLYFLRLRQLAARMQLRLEERLEERERIARDLHDTLLQGISSASMQLDVANDRLASDSPAKPLVERVIKLMQQVSDEGRNAIQRLRSSQHESENLEESLSRIWEEFASEKHVNFRVIVEGLPRSLHPVIRDEVYRIGREAVINAFRHAHASEIEVEVEYAPGNLRILVRDNGRGIDDHVLHAGREGHWGLPGMRERAEKVGATLTVLSRADAGTEIELSIPGNVAFESVSSDHLWKRITKWFRGKTEADHQSHESGASHK